jgi:L-rhamnose mutarotase
LDGLRRSHIVDYSINFLPSPPFTVMDQPSEDIGGLLIATFKYVGQDFESDMKRAAEDEETQRWWKVTDGMQRSLVEGAKSSEDGGWWYLCDEVFRFEK